MVNKDIVVTGIVAGLTIAVVAVGFKLNWDVEYEFHENGNIKRKTSRLKVRTRKLTPEKAAEMLAVTVSAIKSISRVRTQGSLI